MTRWSVLRHGIVNTAARDELTSQLVPFRRRRDSWKGARIAREMLPVGVSQLEQPVQDVYPFWLLTETLKRLPDGLPRPARFLELGCGTGHYSELIASEFPGRFTYTGSDYSPDMIAAARAQWPSREFLVADVLDPGLDLSGYDVVCAAGLIEVMKDWRTALDAVLAAPAAHVVLHRQRIADGETRVEIERHYAGRKTYCAYIAMRDLERVAEAHGRRVAAQVWHEGEQHHTFLLSRVPV